MPSSTTSLRVCVPVQLGLREWPSSTPTHTDTVPVQVGNVPPTSTTTVSHCGSSPHVGAQTRVLSQRRRLAVQLGLRECQAAQPAYGCVCLCKLAKTCQPAQPHALTHCLCKLARSRQPAQPMRHAAIAPSSAHVCASAVQVGEGPPTSTTAAHTWSHGEAFDLHRVASPLDATHCELASFLSKRTVGGFRWVRRRVGIIF